MILNGREVHFFYSIDAYCSYNDWVIAHQNAAVSRGVIERAIIMNKAYNRVHGIDESEDLTYDELKALPFAVYNELVKEVDEQIKKDSTITIETKEPKRKNARNPQASN